MHIYTHSTAQRLNIGCNAVHHTREPPTSATDVCCHAAPNPHTNGASPTHADHCMSPLQPMQVQMQFAPYTQSCPIHGPSNKRAAFMAHHAGKGKGAHQSSTPADAHGRLTIALVTHACTRCLMLPSRAKRHTNGLILAHIHARESHTHSTHSTIQPMPPAAKQDWATPDNHAVEKSRPSSPLPWTPMPIPSTVLHTVGDPLQTCTCLPIS